jgi:hypothetical protein
MATRRSARARGPADVEMPAAEPTAADEADPSIPSEHKSILKKTPSARAPSPTMEHEEEDHFDALFGALMPADATVALVVADWRAKHGADPEAALAELYTLIARVRFRPQFPDTPRTGRRGRRKSQMCLKSRCAFFWRLLEKANRTRARRLECLTVSPVPAALPTNFQLTSHTPFHAL